MNKSPADRLKAAREKRYETAKDAAVAHGWNEVTYRSHESGTRNFPMSAARKYSQAFGVSVQHLLGIAGGYSAGVNQVTSAPLVARVSAGTFRMDEGVEEGAIPVPIVPRDDVPASAQYAVLVDGQSVNKRIPDGAYAICARYESYPGGAKHGQLVHVVRERAGLHEHTIKELHFTLNGQVLMPVSTDPKHQKPVKLDTGDDGEIVRIEGVVIGVFLPF